MILLSSPDRVVALRAARGDARAQEALVRRHRPWLVRMLRRRGLDAHLAEDVVQEALLAAQLALQPDRVPRDVRAWLATIAVRRAADVLRRDRHTLPFEAADAVAAPGDAELATIERERLGHVLDGLAALPERQRRALVLSVLEGRSLEDIARELDGTVQVAKSLVARARRTLGERLAEQQISCAEIQSDLRRAAARGVRPTGVAVRHLSACEHCVAYAERVRRRRPVLTHLLAHPVAAAMYACHRLGLDVHRLAPLLEPATSAKLCATACLAGLALPVGAREAAQPGAAAPRAAGTEVREHRPARAPAPRTPRAAVRRAPVVAAPAARPPVDAAPRRATRDVAPRRARPERAAAPRATTNVIYQAVYATGYRRCAKLGETQMSGRCMATARDEAESRAATRAELARAERMEAAAQRTADARHERLARAAQRAAPPPEPAPVAPPAAPVSPPPLAVTPPAAPPDTPSPAPVPTEPAATDPGA